MEVKYEKKGINLSEIAIYINNLPWRVVKTSYFEKKLPRLIKSGDFKKEFKSLEKKKIINVSVYLLSKRSYLKKEWFSKMKDKLFDQALLETVFQEHLSPYFNEGEELERRVNSYLARGKGKRYISQKLSPYLSISRSEFEELLHTLCPQGSLVEKIQSIESTRNLLNIKGREKTIAFFLRRGFSYDDINKALF